MLKPADQDATEFLESGTRNAHVLPPLLCLTGLMTCCEAVVDLVPGPNLLQVLAGRRRYAESQS
jgi:hypothetical protein